MSKKDLPEGMTLRGRTYHADFRCHGRRCQRRLSRDFRTAKELLIEMRARAERGEMGLLDNNVPMDALRTQYMRHCRQTLKDSTVHRYEQNLNAIFPHLPPRASQLTIQPIIAYRESRLAAGISPRTINMDVGAVATMLNWAAGKNVRLIDSNPLAGLERLPHDHQKEGRALERDEVAVLLKTSGQPWEDIWYAFLVTGVRKTELASLLFTDIDWAAREIVVQRGIAKNHCSRRIPIDDHLWEILCRLRGERDDRRPGWCKTQEITDMVQERFSRDRVFVTNHFTPWDQRSALYKAFIRCCKHAGIQTRTVGPDGHEIDHVDLHSLRRTYATDLIEQGADPKTVQRLLGHKTLDMTMQIYAKIRGGSLRQAVARLSYGAGCSAPDHVVEFPPERRRIPTTDRKADVG